MCGRRQESIAEMASIREELFTSGRRLQEKDAEVDGAQKLQAGDGSGLGTAAG